MLPQELIAAKRDHRALARQDIDAFVRGIADGRIADEQLGAFAMAVRLNGMDRDETVALTLAMRDSGRIMSWPMLPGPVLDKHSTGGVGDAVSLILGPWVAACGGFVPMISGRGLGHTGGTLDKLSSIPGYDPFPDPNRLTKVVSEIGVAIIGQTRDLAPADRRFYAIRDVTATVDCLPLIVASILSKKLAAGLDALVMDVKSGSGSVIGGPEQAIELARAICDVASLSGLKTGALVTDMNEVLSNAAGNALEIRESIDVLTGRITEGRLLDVTRELSIALLVDGGLAASRTQARQKLDATLASGEAAERFARMVEALGGPSDLLEHPERHLPKAPVEIDVHAENEGIVTQIDVRTVGMSIIELGGGRTRADQTIDPAVGLTGVAGIGAAVNRDQPLARIHAADRESAERAARRLQAAYVTGATAPPPSPLVIRSLQAIAED